MKLSSSLTWSALAAILSLAPEAAISQSTGGNLKGVNANLKQNFFEWVKEHGKEYPDPKELLTRMEVWMDNHGALRCVAYDSFFEMAHML